MSKINPVHIIISLSVLALFLFVQVQRSKGELIEQRVLFLQTKEIAQKTAAYKKLYAKKNKKILRYMLTSFAKNGNLHMKQNQNSFIVSSTSLSLSVLNSLLSKIFNGAYKIEKLEIKKIDKRYASFRLEITW